MVNQIQSLACQLQKPLQWGVHQFCTIREKTDHIAIKTLNLIAAVFAIVLGLIPYLIGALTKRCLKASNQRENIQSLLTIPEEQSLQWHQWRVLRENQETISQYHIREGGFIGQGINGEVMVHYANHLFFTKYEGCVTGDTVFDGFGTIYFHDGTSVRAKFANGVMVEQHQVRQAPQI